MFYFRVYSRAIFLMLCFLIFGVATLQPVVMAQPQGNCVYYNNHLGGINFNAEAAVRQVNQEAFALSQPDSVVSLSQEAQSIASSALPTSIDYGVGIMVVGDFGEFTLKEAFRSVNPATTGIPHAELVLNHVNNLFHESGRWQPDPSISNEYVDSDKRWTRWTPTGNAADDAKLIFVAAVPIKNGVTTPEVVRAIQAAINRLGNPDPSQADFGKPPVLNRFILNLSFHVLPCSTVTGFEQFASQYLSSASPVSACPQSYTLAPNLSQLFVQYLCKRVVDSGATVSDTTLRQEYLKAVVPVDAANDRLNQYLNNYYQASSDNINFGVNVAGAGHFGGLFTPTDCNSSTPRTCSLYPAQWQGVISVSAAEADGTVWSAGSGNPVASPGQVLRKGAWYQLQDKTGIIATGTQYQASANLWYAGSDFAAAGLSVRLAYDLLRTTPICVDSAPQAGGGQPYQIDIPEMGQRGFENSTADCN